MLYSKRANPKYQNPESEAMLVSAFKREFARKLTDMLGLTYTRTQPIPTKQGVSYAKLHANYISTPLSSALGQEIGREKEQTYSDPKRHILTFDQVDEMAQRMGFL